MAQSFYSQLWLWGTYHSQMKLFNFSVKSWNILQKNQSSCEIYQEAKILIENKTYLLVSSKLDTKYLNLIQFILNFAGFNRRTYFTHINSTSLEQMQQDKKAQEVRKITEKFDLQVSFTENILKIVLKDFQDWSVYEKSYSNEDTGCGQIHKKADLIDIFAVLNQPQQSYPEYKNVEQQKQEQSYKVEAEGKMTIYMTIKSSSTPKPIQCHSNLTLNKVRKLTSFEIEIYQSMLMINQNQNKQIESLRMKNAGLHNRITKLEKDYAESQKIRQQATKKLKKDAERYNKIGIKNGRYRLRHHNGGNMGCDQNWSVYLTDKVGAWEEWIIETKNDCCLIKSYHGAYLRGNPEGKVGACMNVSTWEEWHVEVQGQYIFLKTNRGTYLHANKDYQVYLSGKKDDASKRKLIP